MKIRYLELVGYKPLLLNGIKRFTITPKQVHQLLIGTNGSGKTSVMRELSPMPGGSGNYVQGGFKRIVIDDKLDEYDITTDFSAKQAIKHTFKLNKVELNPGGTGAVQKELIWKYFKLDDDIVDVLQDDVKFTKMSPQQRREWIMRLSGGDLTYAVRVFNRLKSRARDMVGVVKHLNGRLNQESSKLPTKENVEENMKLSEQLKNELTAMMEAKNLNVKEEHYTIKGYIESLFDEINKRSSEIMKIDIRRPAMAKGFQIASINDIITVETNLKFEYESMITLYKHHAEEYQKIEEIVQALDKTKAQGIDDLKKFIDNDILERDSLVKQIKQFNVINDPNTVMTVFDGIVGELNLLFNELKDNSDNRFNRQEKETKNLLLTETIVLKEKKVSDKGKFLHRIEHLAKEQKINCPSCGYIFVAGSLNGEPEQLQKTIDRLDNEIKALDDTIDTCNIYLEEYKSYADIRNQIARIINTTPTLKILWDYIHDIKLLTDSPRRAKSIFLLFKHDLTLHIRINALQQNINLYTDAINQATSVAGDTHYIDRMSSLEEKLSLYSQRKVDIQKQLGDIVKYRDNVKTVTGHYEKIKEAYMQIDELASRYIDSYRNQVLVKTIRDHQSLLAQTEQQLVTANALKDIIADLEKSCVKAQADAQVYKLLADELSPTEGLIADMLKGFICTLTDQVNAIIDQVWTYDLKVLPCGIDTDELDYKFPLEVKNHEMTVPDVSKASSSQVDIIDFSFKLIVMLYLGFEDYPLYLDELAPSLDEQHRLNIMMFVRSLVDTKKCSQMYMVSHYVESFGSLQNAEICMMDDANILHLPAIYNNHVTFE